MKLLWEEIHRLSMDISSISINFFYSNMKQIVSRVEELIQGMEQAPQNEGPLCTLMQYLNKQENAKTLFKFDV